MGINIKSTLQESKYCKSKGYYFNLLIPIEITEDNYLDYATPFKFSFAGKNNKEDYFVENIRTVGDEITIYTYRDFDFKVDDLIRIGEKFYHIQNVQVSYEESDYVVVKRHYITLR